MATSRRPPAPIQAADQPARRLREIQSVFDYAPLGLSLVDTEMRYVYVNEYLARMNHLPPHEHFGKSVDEIIPDLATEVREACRQVLESGEPLVNREVAGKGQHHLVSYYPVHAENGTIFGVGAVIQDITQRKEMEQALRESEERFRTIYENAPVMIDAFDQEGRSLLWNHECEKNLGWTRAEVQRCRDPLRLTYPDPDLHRRVLSAIQAADGRFRESTVRAKDGSDRVQLWANFRLPNGNLICVGIDITERTRAEEALRDAHEELERRVEERTAELLRANVALEHAVGGHRKTEEMLLEQREQLRALASKLSVAEERERRRIAAELHDHVVQNLGLARMRLGRLRASLTDPTDLQLLDGIQDLIGETIDDSRSLIFEVSPPVLYEFGFEAAVEWLADHIQERHGIECAVVDSGPARALNHDVMVVLFQAVRELLINVVKHARARRANVSIASRDGFIRVCVEDDGVGMSPSVLEDKETRAGSFGLFSIRERLTPLGGAIEIGPAPARGSRIVLTAPLREA